MLEGDNLIDHVSQDNSPEYPSKKLKSQMEMLDMLRSAVKEELHKEVEIKLPRYGTAKFLWGLWYSKK